MPNRLRMEGRSEVEACQLAGADISKRCVPPLNSSIPQPPSSLPHLILRQMTNRHHSISTEIFQKVLEDKESFLKKHNHSAT